MNKRFILYLIVLLGLFSSVYSIGTDNVLSYYPLTTDGTDVMGFLNLTVSSATTTSTNCPVESSCMDFDGVNDYLYNNAKKWFGTSSDFTICLWFNADDISSQDELVSQYNSGGSDFYYGFAGTVMRFTGTYQVAKTTLGITSTGTNYHTCVVRDYTNSNGHFYTNGVLKDSKGTMVSFTTTADIAYIGRQGSINGEYYDGRLNNVVIFNKALNSSEVLDVYTNGIEFSSTPTINYNITNNTYLNYNTNISLNTSTNTNMSYIFNGGNETSICNNCNQSSILTSLVYGQNNFTFISNDHTGEVNNSLTLYYDNINPSLSTSFPTEYNYYNNFNITNYISFSDDYLDTCSITINAVNTSCYYNNYNFSLNGNLTINITLTDLAGNTNTSSDIIFVNPYMYYYFEEPDTTPITTFEIDGTTTNNYYSFKVYDYGLGSHSFEFSALGFETQTINFNLNTTSNINTTYTANEARIIIYIRDKVTGSLITGETFNAEFVATIGLNTTSTAGIVNVTNTLFEDEEYLVVITNPNYQTESIYFEFTNREVIELNAYMADVNETNLGAVFIKTVNLFGQVIEGATVKALQWDSSTSSYKEVSQSKTSSDGLGTLNIILNDKIYIFTGIYNGYASNTTAEIIDTTENGKTITITLRDTATEHQYLFENVFTNVTESYNTLTNISTITFQWEDTQGYSRTVCINSYRQMRGTENQLTQNCTSGVSGIYILNFNINASYTTVLKGEILEGGVLYTMDEFLYLPEGNINEVLDSLGLAIFIVPLLFLGAIALGMLVENTAIGTLVLVLFAGVSLLISPDILSKSIVAFLFFMGWLTIHYGGKTR